MNWILGIGGYSHDASAALLREGQLVCAAQGERFTRIKHNAGFPVKAIKFCLEQANIAAADISAVAFYTRRSNWDRILWSVGKSSVQNIGYSLSHRRGLVLSLGYRAYMSLKFRAELDRFFEESGFEKRVFIDYDHHACHAASAFFSSPFDQAIILCIDSVGDGKTTSAWLGEGNHLYELPDARMVHPHSIAHVYNRLTKYLGFLSTGDEYKVMGLAAYGHPTYLERLRNLVILERADSVRLNMDYFTYQYEFSLSDRFYHEFGPPRTPGQPITEHWANMAASVQKLFEELVLRIVLHLKARMGIRKLCLGGGAALNCKCNGKLIKTGEFDQIFVPPGASDLGTSIGAAQYHWHQVMDKPRSFVLKRDDWGPEYDDRSIHEELTRFGLKYEQVPDPAQAAGELIALGNIVGWFQGRMEFGPRALGYRSILADPRHEAIRPRYHATATASSS